MKIKSKVRGGGRCDNPNFIWPPADERFIPRVQFSVISIQLTSTGESHEDQVQGSRRRSLRRQFHLTCKTDTRIIPQV